MPGRTRIKKDIRGALDRLWNGPELGGRSEWTAATKQALSVCGHKFDFWVSSTINEAAIGQARGADEGEWLYDVVWSTYDETPVFDGYCYMESIVLVAECEWDIRQGAIYRDFQKLLLARADLRLMIFDGTNPDLRNEVFGHIAEYIDRFERTQHGDTYLLAASDDHEARFHYRRVDVRNRLRISDL